MAGSDGFVSTQQLENERLGRRIARLESDLLECREYLEGYVDVYDGTDAPRPNRAMVLITQIDSSLNGGPY
jgi:hypothetical protein